MSIPVTPSPDESLGRISPGKSLEPAGSSASKPAADFDSYMQESKTQKTASFQNGSGPSPMDLGRSQMTAAALNPTALMAQAKNAQDSLGTVKKQLSTPNLKLKRSQSHLLRNKLQDANTHLRAAGTKLGLQPQEMKIPQNASPVERFLAYVNDGQEQMVQVQKKLQDLAAKGQQLNPADMLSVQVKLNAAQQETEYASMLLSKVVESIRTIINVQL